MSKITPKTKSALRTRRHTRIRARLSGTEERPRLAVYRSNKFVYAQIIDDDKGITLVAATAKGAKKMSLVEQAKFVGVAIAKAAVAKGITKVAFDRGGFSYAGRIAALADAAREGGLKF
jgi:large subunit ribosomal protein L18